MATKILSKILDIPKSNVIGCRGHCAAVVYKLDLSLLLSELLKQSLLCKTQKGLGYCGPEFLNLKVEIP